MKDKSIQQVVPITDPLIFEIKEEWHVARARQAAQNLAEKVGLRRVWVYYVATAVSELANNLFFHTSRGGILTLRGVQWVSAVGVEVIAEDKGPGIPNIEEAMQDGFSTNGGLGGGLPGIQRLMDEFELHSQAGIGTRIIIRKWEKDDC